MTYKEFLNYIFSRHSSNIKLGLERIENILQTMDTPNEKLGGIHIAGTNGKGSTAAICEAIAKYCGYSTGLYTSPHLKDYTERFRIDGAPIDYKELLVCYCKWERVFTKMDASFFEMTTAMAFEIFCKKAVEVAIVEVGLGGRLDATNLFKSNVSVVSSISYDHTKILGQTKRLIAEQKGGIIKTNQAVICGKMAKETLRVLLEIADKQNSYPVVFGKDFWIENVQTTPKCTTFDYLFGEYRLKRVKTNLLGNHQALNAAYAITAFIEFAKTRGYPINIQAIKTGLTQVMWDGRLQIIGQKPTVVIDGAHNTAAMANLVDNLKIIFPKKEFLFVVSILRDKDLSAMFADICPLAKRVFIAKNSSPRAADNQTQTEAVKTHGVDFTICSSVGDAKNLAIEMAEKDDVVVICGSLYTISDII